MAQEFRIYLSANNRVIIESVSNKIEIEGNLDCVTIRSLSGLVAAVSKDYCLCELRQVTFNLRPEDYRTMEVIIEMARELRRDAGIEDD